MWFLLHFLPTEIITLITFNVLFIGLIIQILILFCPPFPYKILTNFASIILIIFGTYGFSSSDVEKHWRDEMKKVEDINAKLKIKAETVTEKIVTVYVDKVKVVKGKTNEIQKQIKTQITEKSDNACKLSNTFVWLHDSAAKNDISIPAEGVDETPSDVNLSTATETIADNYGKYYEVAEQLKSLQDWVISQQELFNKEGDL